MSLSVAIRHRLGTFELDTAFESQGRLTAIFGASGSGKTSVINAIAGLIRPNFGRIVIDGTVLTDTDTDFAIPVHKRSIGYVFQDARLFPHLSVQQNLGYGRWFTPMGKRYADMAQVLALLDISPLLDRKPHQLSGGEKQRVALGRSLLQSPRLLLMDEPLASLDQTRKLEIMPYIERLRDELQIPIVYVSHSVAEVARLATDIAAMANGRVTAFGAAEDMVPRLSAEAGDGTGTESALLNMTVMSYDPSLDLTRLSSAAGEASIPGPAAAMGQVVRLRIHARDVIIATEKPKGLSALNILSGKIVRIDAQPGAAVLVTIDCSGSMILARITKHSRAALALQPELHVHAVVKSMAVETPGPAPARKISASDGPPNSKSSITS
jgi:molybdate transport system ATP-binding protein